MPIFCHIPYLTSKPFKSNSDVFGLASDLYSDITSTLLFLTPFVAMQPPLLFLLLLLFLLFPIVVTSDLHSYLQYPPVIILIICLLVSCYDPLFPSHI